ncbi:phosphopantetheine-binding protein [Rhizobium sp. VS19-DR104.2]|uniref:phosphopantetheine-binding protein n=1 Tax=unclassified Rhizobium TaxID=2613769 RepID=UPI001CC34EA1|nr:MULTISPECIES: phosphopantetheine-binding protein [unclassified Rhizobium]MBZ5763806.1 phosphopantetheine-binding protein [Rhizobium sp. VS19-DR96]MBZ5769737.1 phosphopantetheine-binding protein [Rhizobium sp. VS19-DR129.2]MBZ5777279.1 phosphopantetheine-binding protein [Rhizobium sp. VS19-DRK62.2]MBZ5788407.1 phosphopantetheine-binding protein [Rhizobium sp. VS19-DR121]MBZ5805854.1 phosphopantetheine-binding protein [Rhizobium sp. VS19-DR181]
MSTNHTVLPNSVPFRLDELDDVGIAFRHVLNVETVDYDKNFFEMGGQSLQAVKLVNFIRVNCGKELTFAAFFAMPTVRGVATALRTAEPARPPITPQQRA